MYTLERITQKEIGQNISNPDGSLQQDMNGRYVRVMTKLDEYKLDFSEGLSVISKDKPMVDSLVRGEKYKVITVGGFTMIKPAIEIYYTAPLPAAIEPPEITPEIVPEITPEIVPEITPEIVPEITPEIVPEITPEIVPEITPEIVPETV